jgi:hypothetical protein
MMLVVRVGIVIPGVGELFGGFVFFVKMPLLGGGLKGVCAHHVFYTLEIWIGFWGTRNGFAWLGVFLFGIIILGEAFRGTLL